MSTLLNGLLAVVGIGGMFLILIAPHEGGHFLVAKLFKVRVIEFSIGAGTKLLSFTRGGTAVRAEGLPDPRLRPDGRHGGGRLRRAERLPLQAADASGSRILAAGPIANFLVAMLLDHRLRPDAAEQRPGQGRSRVVAGRPAGPGRAPGRATASAPSTAEPSPAPGSSRRSRTTTPARRWCWPASTRTASRSRSP